MVINYIPEICQKEGAPVTGSLKLRMMSFPERQRMRKDIGIFSTKHQAKEGEELSTAQRLENLEAVAMVAEKIYPLISEVDLKINNEVEIKNADELYSHPACEPIVTELIEKYLFGFASKNS